MNMQIAEMTMVNRPLPIEQDAARQLIVEAARRKGLTFADLSRAIERNNAYVHQFIHRGSPRNLPEDVRHLLATILDVPEDRLRSKPLPEGAELATRASFAAPPRHVSANIASDQTIPVFSDRDEIDPAKAREWIPRPRTIGDAQLGFAIWVSTRRGRIRPGDLIYVRTTQPPPRPGDDVVVLRGTEIVDIGEMIDLEQAKVTLRDNAGAPVIIERSSDTRVMKIGSITSG
jgi:hypothetical protein